MDKREPIEWCDIKVWGADGGTLPKVLLVGDSIVQLYFPEVREKLVGKFDCGRLATSACVCQSRFRKELSSVLDRYTFSLIHFNNGLHGFDYNEKAYARSLARTLDYLARRSPRSKLIWVASTPIRKEGALNEFDPRNDRVLERNRIAARQARERNMPMDDLYALVESHPEYFKPDACHFNPAGTAVLSEQVARCVQANAPSSRPRRS